MDGGQGIALELPDVRRAWFCPSGEVLLASSSGSLLLADGRSGAALARAELPGPIEAAVFSGDGALAAVTTRDGALRLLSRELREVASRPAPGWQSTPDALLALEGWSGFSLAHHPFRGRRAGPWFEVVDLRSGARVAEVPSADDLVPDATGTRWAGPDAHLVLGEEGRSDPNRAE